jgi:arylsulfatase
MGLIALLLCGCSHEPARPNILVIVVDTLRADHLSCAGYERDTTPHLDQFAAEGLRFTHAQSPRAKTTPAVASIFTGLYPHGHGVRDLATPLDTEITLLAERLRTAGYTTGAIISNFVLRDDLSGLARGFDHWVEDLPQTHGVPPHHVPQRTATSVTDGALCALGLGLPSTDGAGPTAPFTSSADEPWFLWLHYMDPHGLYNPPPEHDRFSSPAPRPVPEEPSATLGAITQPHLALYNLLPSDRLGEGQIDAARVIDRYDGEISYVDAELGRLFEALRTAGAMSDTLILVVADHGESLGEHNYWFEHGRHTYEATCRVPLLIRLPDNFKDRPDPGVRHGDVSLADLSPTLTELLSLKALNPQAAPQTHGHSIVPLLITDRTSPHPVFSEKVERPELRGAIQSKAVRLGDWKYIRRYTHTQPGTAKTLSEELYHLLNDPSEAHNLISAPPATAPLNLLRAHLLVHSSSDLHFPDLARELQDPETLRILKSLGY